MPPTVPTVKSIPKPRLRGVTHEWAFFLFLGLGIALVATSPPGKAMLATIVYAVSVPALFGASALYHRINWRRPSARRWMRRLDHTMIFVLIAGTYTPFAVLVLEGTLSTLILTVVWGGAIAGTILNFFWTDAPKWVSAVVYVSLGWVAVAAMPQIADRLGITGVTLLALGGLLYTAGAIIYARQRPNPAPTYFGYHEIFHLFVIVAAALQYAVVAFLVLPNA